MSARMRPAARALIDDGDGAHHTAMPPRSTANRAREAADQRAVIERGAQSAVADAGNLSLFAPACRLWPRLGPSAFSAPCPRPCAIPTSHFPDSSPSASHFLRSPIQPPHLTTTPALLEPVRCRLSAVVMAAPASSRRRWDAVTNFKRHEPLFVHRKSIEITSRVQVSAPPMLLDHALSRLCTSHRIIATSCRLVFATAGFGEWDNR